MANETDRLGIILETTSEGTGFQDVQDDFKKTEQEGKQSSENLEKSYQESFTKIRNASAIAFAAVAAGIGLSVKAYSEQEDADNRVRASVQLTGRSYAEFSGKLAETAARLQAITRYGDDQTLSVFSELTLLTGDADKAFENINLTLDVAAGLQQDVSTASRNVALALEGETGMLARYIPALRSMNDEIGENATKSERAAFITGVLRESFGGLAEEEGKTLSSSFIGLKNDIGDVTEEIGSAFAPAVRGATEDLRPLIRGIAEWAGEHEELVAIVGGGALTLSAAAATITTIGLAAPVAARGLVTLRVASISLAASPWTVIAAGVIAVAGVVYQLGDAMTSAGESEQELNEIVKETGVEYQVLRQKQEEVFGKFSDYRSGTDAQREAWDNYVTALKAGIPTLDEVIVTMQAAVFAPPPVVGLTQTIDRNFDTEGLDTSIEQMGNDLSVSNHQLMLDKKAIADEEAERQRQELWEQSRDSFLYHTGFLQNTYRSAIGTLADTEMTGKERREAIWGQFRSNVVGYIADVTARYVFGELAKRAATAATATVGIAASSASAAVEVGNANKVTASWMAAAYAKLVAFYAFAGPLAPVFAVGTIGAAIAGLGAIVASAMGAVKMQEGGIVPGAGNGDKIPALLEPGERVINRDEYNANAGGIESAIRGGSGGGNSYHFHLDKETSQSDVLKIRAMFETWVVPVIEQKEREGAFRMPGVPA